MHARTRQVVNELHRTDTETQNGVSSLILSCLLKVLTILLGFYWLTVKSAGSWMQAISTGAPAGLGIFTVMCAQLFICKFATLVGTRCRKRGGCECHCGTRGRH